MIRTQGAPDTKGSTSEPKTVYPADSERDIDAAAPRDADPGTERRIPARSGDPAVDPKVVYWTFAWLDLALAVGCACSGVIQIRRGRIEAHRRRMLLGASLILLFLLSYPVKLGFLGREALEEWAPSFVGVLRFHELCILVMLIAGVLAIRLGARIRPAPDATLSEADPAARRSHRLAGRTAFVAALAGLLSSAYVLLGMYLRLGPG